ncbi:MULTISPECIES: hypothetical protein [unclassified Meiothermus]|uniref:hypothetical protein n=1 Tax=unclassified Meiothermus TaxID=370471 RepID=UPI000D7BA75D|nr:MULTISPECIES: hypothetical protein [unclassified Meiothermus]PZA06994.1 hypothetical protein DNA98_10045 [Meiothermus sp. Pnk-1]RYM35304.1 hypothetical protein EWH23_11875 [Meiothermus sp. PNK-Is4]
MTTVVYGENKKLRKQIESLEAVIAEHEAKIAREQAKPQPDVTLIRKWQKDIERARLNIRKREKRPS